MVIVVFGGLIWVFWLELFISVFTLLPQLNANREYSAYIESQREHFVLFTFVPAPPAAYSESQLIPDISGAQLIPDISGAQLIMNQGGT